MPFLKNTRGIDTVKLFILALMLLVVIKGLIFAIVIPENEIPDEQKYYQNMQDIADGKIPYFKDTSASGHPVLYEIIMQPLFLAGKAIGGSDLTYFLLRLLSTLFFALTVYITFLISRIIFKDDQALQVLAPAIIALNPQVGFMASALSPESLLNLLFSLFLLLLVRTIMIKFSYKDTFFIVLLIIAGLLIKERFLVSLPLLVIALGMKGSKLFGFIKNKIDFKHGIARASASYGIIVLGIAATYKISQVLIAYFQHAYITTPHKGLHLYSFLLKILKQFWGFFGWLQIPLPKSIYLLLGLLLIVAGLGLIKFIKKFLSNQLNTNQRLSLILVGLAVIFTTVVVFGYEWRTGTSQGRYLFIAISPISFLIALGLSEILKKRLLTFATSSIILGLAALNIYSLIWVIFPFYH